MNTKEWQIAVNKVTEEMREFTRPFVTPICTSGDKFVQLEGTGTYVLAFGNRLILTCEHVEKKGPMEYRFYGSENVYRHQGSTFKEPHPVDTALAVISDRNWNVTEHKAFTVPYEKFANKHSPIDRCEILFFRGFAGENAAYVFGEHHARGAGYSTQEVQIDEPDEDVFDIFWDPQQTTYTEETSEESRASVKMDNPHGFSGSLLWNTRFREVGENKWSPEDAVVTGLVRRWDDKEKTLMVYRIEHLRAWIGQQFR